MLYYVRSDEMTRKEVLRMDIRTTTKGMPNNIVSMFHEPIITEENFTFLVQDILNNLHSLGVKFTNEVGDYKLDFNSRALKKLGTCNRKSKQGGY